MCLIIGKLSGRISFFDCIQQDPQAFDDLDPAVRLDLAGHSSIVSGHIVFDPAEKSLSGRRQTNADPPTVIVVGLALGELVAHQMVNGAAGQFRPEHGIGQG
jgi:hypothetical protein